MKLPFRKALYTYLLNILSALLTITLCWSYQTYVGMDKFIIMYVAPVLIAASTGAFLTFIQHSHPGSYVFDKKGFDPVLSHVHGTFNIRFPKWMEYFWLEINIHTPHHILPGIPWYFLNDANEILKSLFPNLINERPFSVSYLRAKTKQHMSPAGISASSRYVSTTSFGFGAPSLFKKSAKCAPIAVGTPAKSP